MVTARWGKLTDDHLDVIAGKRHVLAGKIQESYGITEDEAEEQIKSFEDQNKYYQPPKKRDTCYPQTETRHAEMLTGIATAQQWLHAHVGIKKLTMKRFVCAAAVVTSAIFTFPVNASDVGVSISIGGPNFYGRIDIGDYPARN